MYSDYNEGGVVKSSGSASTAAAASKGYDDIFGDDDSDEEAANNRLYTQNDNENNAYSSSDNHRQTEYEFQPQTSKSSYDEDSSDEWGPDLMGDEEDRRHLASLTEMERESILYDRAQVRQRRLEKQELRRRLKQKDAERLSSAKNASAPSKRDDHMKNLLEAKEKKHRRKAAGAIPEDEGETLQSERDKLEKRIRANDDDANTINAEEDETLLKELDLDDVNSIFLTRSMAEKYLFRSFFPEMVKGT